MICFAAHYLYVGHGELLTRHIVCLDEMGCIYSIQPLNDETATTVFLNGLLCAAFDFPGSNEWMTPLDATSFFSKIRDINPQLQIKEILESFTNDSELKVGDKPNLWCIESLDLKKLLLLNETTVYSVFP
ncbi:MAG TPA: hypothetical protein VIK20_05570 [Bacteroidales bacterium]